MPTIPVFDPDGSVHQVTLPERARRASPMSPDDRREAVLAAAIPLLRARGASVTTRELADAAGVAEGTLFRVFPDKGALLHAAIERAIDPAPVVARFAALDPDLPLRVTLRTVVSVLQERSGDVAVLIAASHELADGSHPRHGPPKRNPVEIVVRAVADVLHPHAEELRLAPVVCAGMLAGLVISSTRMFGSKGSPPLTPEQIVEFFLDGALIRSSSVEDPC